MRRASTTRPGTGRSVTRLGDDAVGLRISGNPASGCRLRFDRCRIADSVPGNREMSPITFMVPHGSAEDVGNAEFVDCAVKDSAARPPITLLDWTGRRRLARVTGSMAVEVEGKSTRYTLDAKTLGEWMPVLALKDIPQVALAGMRLDPAMPGAAVAGGDAIRLRGDSEFLLHAEKDRPASFSVQFFPVGPAGAPVAVRVLSPSGKEIPAPKAPPQQKTPYEFAAAEAGTYRIQVEAGGAAVVLASAAHRLVACGEKVPFHFFKSGGTFHFWVPPGTSEFGVKVTAGAIGELVKASLVDPSGKTAEEKDNILKPHLFIAKSTDPSKGEVWSLRLGKPSEGVFEDCFVDLLGIPPLLAGSPGALLKPVKP